MKLQINIPINTKTKTTVTTQVIPCKTTLKITRKIVLTTKPQIIQQIAKALKAANKK